VSGLRVVGIVLLVVGLLAVAYGGFSYTKDETAAKIGPVEIQVQEKERVNIPLWAGIVTAVAGAVLLVRRS
jgi:hypothetical protein